LNPILILIKKELKVEFRSLQGIVASSMLSLMILMSFRFSLTDTVMIQNSGVIWSSILLTGIGLVTHISTREVERGTMELLKLAPISRYQLFLGRMIGSLSLLWILSTIIFMMYLFLFGNLFDEKVLMAFIVVLVGCIGISAVAVLAANSATPLHGGWMITSIFAIPILLFTVIEAAVRATDSLITGSSDFEIAFLLLALYSVVFVTGGAWLSEIAD